MGDIIAVLAALAVGAGFLFASWNVWSVDVRPAVGPRRAHTARGRLRIASVWGKDVREIYGSESRIAKLYRYEAYLIEPSGTEHRILTDWSYSRPGGAGAVLPVRYDPHDVKSFRCRKDDLAFFRYSFLAAAFLASGIMFCCLAGYGAWMRFR